MYCPECRSEFVAGVTVCPDCEVPLVAELPPLGEEPTFELVTVFESGDPAALAAAKSALLGAQVSFSLVGERIQTLFGVGPLGSGFNQVTGPAKIQVRGDEADEARAVLAGVAEGAEPPGEAEPPAADAAAIESWRKARTALILSFVILPWITLPLAFFHATKGIEALDAAGAPNAALRRKLRVARVVSGFLAALWWTVTIGFWVYFRS